MKVKSGASGFQIAFFTLAANFISIPVGRMVVGWLGWTRYEATFCRALVFLIGIAAIAAFPGARRRALAYLRSPVMPTRRKELLAVIAVDVSVISFGIAGGIAAWNWWNHGPEAFKRHSSESAQIAAALSPEGLALVVLAALVAPVIEELVFRGFLLDAWRLRYGWTISAFLTSAVFAVYHPYFVAAFFQSLIFICVLRRTGSLRGAIAIHACANLSLWYPLFGRFVFPSNPEGEFAIWVPHFVSLAVAMFLIPGYVWLAWSHKSSPEFAALPENEIRA